MPTAMLDGFPVITKEEYERRKQPAMLDGFPVITKEELERRQAQQQQQQPAPVPESVTPQVTQNPQPSPAFMPYSPYGMPMTQQETPSVEDFKYAAQQLDPRPAFKGITQVAPIQGMQADFPGRRASAILGSNIIQEQLGFKPDYTKYEQLRTREQVERQDVPDTSQMGIVAQGLQGTTNIVSGIAESALHGGVPGAVVGGVAGAVPTLGAGAIPGAVAGGGLGMTSNFYLQGVGDIYETLLQNDIEPDTAMKLAIAGGLPYAALEKLQFKVLAKPIKGMGSKVFGEAVEKVAKTNPGLAATLAKGLKEYGVAVGTETVTEGLQKGVEEGSVAVGLGVEGRIPEAVQKLQSIPGAMAQEMKDVAPSMAMLPIPGTLARTAVEAGAVRADQLRQQGIDIMPRTRWQDRMREWGATVDEKVKDYNIKGDKGQQTTVRGQAIVKDGKRFIITDQAEHFKPQTTKEMRAFLESAAIEQQGENQQAAILGLQDGTTEGYKASYQFLTDPSRGEAAIPAAGTGANVTFEDGTQGDVNALIFLAKPTDKQNVGGTFSHEMMHTILKQFMKPNEYALFRRAAGVNEKGKVNEENAVNLYLNTVMRQQALQAGVEQKGNVLDKAIYRVHQRLTGFSDALFGPSIEGVSRQAASGELFNRGIVDSGADRGAVQTWTGNTPVDVLPTPEGTPYTPPTEMPPMQSPVGEIISEGILPQDPNAALEQIIQSRATQLAQQGIEPEQAVNQAITEATQEEGLRNVQNVPATTEVELGTTEADTQPETAAQGTEATEAGVPVPVRMQDTIRQAGDLLKQAQSEPQGVEATTDDILAGKTVEGVEQEVLLRTPTKKEKAGGVERSRGFYNLEEAPDGYENVYKPYGKDGAGYYRIPKQQPSVQESSVAPAPTQEPWQMTREEYLAGKTDVDDIAISRAAHAQHVKRNVQDAPLNVLQEYSLNGWAQQEIDRRTMPTVEPVVERKPAKHRPTVFDVAEDKAAKEYVLEEQDKADRRQAVRQEEAKREEELLAISNQMSEIEKRLVNEQQAASMPDVQVDPGESTGKTPATRPKNWDNYKHWHNKKLIEHAKERGVKIPKKNRKVDRQTLIRTLNNMNTDNTWATIEMPAEEGKDDNLSVLWSDVKNGGIKPPGKSSSYEDWGYGEGAPTWMRTRRGKGKGKRGKPILRPQGRSWDQWIQYAESLRLLPADAHASDLFDLLERARKWERVKTKTLPVGRITIDEHFANQATAGKPAEVDGFPWEQKDYNEDNSGEDEWETLFSTADEQTRLEHDLLLKRAGNDPNKAWTLYENQLIAAKRRGEPVPTEQSDTMRKLLLGKQEQGDMFGAEPEKPKRTVKQSLTVDRPIQQSLDGLDDGMLFSTAMGREPIEYVKYTAPTIPDAQAKNIISKMVRYFKTTKDPREAGYVMPDGRMLDLSGKRQGSRESGVRHLDHREANIALADIDYQDDNGMLAAQNAGIARVDFNYGLVNFTKPLDIKQKSAIIRGMQQTTPAAIIVQVDDAQTHQTVYDANMDGNDMQAFQRTLNEAHAVMRGERKPERVHYSTRKADDPRRDYSPDQDYWKEASDKAGVRNAYPRKNRYFDRDKPDDWATRSYHKIGVNPEVDKKWEAFRDANRFATGMRKEMNSALEPETRQKNRPGVYDYWNDPTGLSPRRGSKLDTLQQNLTANLEMAQYQEDEAFNDYRNAIMDAGMRYSTAQTDTPQFKRWFGDSKVVDADGKPLVVYHGTRAEKFEGEEFPFTTFHTNLNALGAHFGTDRTQAELRSLHGDIFDVYLSIQNPLRLRDMGSWHHTEVIPQLKSMGIDTRDAEADLAKAFDSEYKPELRKKYGLPDDAGGFDISEKVLQDLIKQNGYDGIVYLNRFEFKGVTNEIAHSANTKNLSDDEFKKIFPVSDSYIVFSPTQIKSATGNSGAFDPDNPDIRYSTYTTDEIEEQRTLALENTLMANGPMKAGPMSDIHEEDDWSKFSEEERVQIINVWYDEAIEDIENIESDARDAAARDEEYDRQKVLRDSVVEDVSKIAQKEGFSFVDSFGYADSSRYVKVEDEHGVYVIRISDHPSPQGGGFSMNTGERHGDPDADIRIDNDGNYDEDDVLEQLNEIKENFHPPKNDLPPRYSTTDTTPRPVPLPELARMTVEMLGSQPQIRRKMQALGLFTREREVGGIKLKADIFIGPDIHHALSRTKPTKEQIDEHVKQMAEEHGVPEKDIVIKTSRQKNGWLTSTYKRDHNYSGWILAHEIGHAEDWLPNKTMARGNILGRIAKLNNFMDDLIGKDPETVNETITPEERQRWEAEAAEPIQGGWEEVTRIIEEFIPGSGITVDDVKAIWNSAESAKGTPLYDFISKLDNKGKVRIARAAMKGTVDPSLAGLSGGTTVKKTVTERVQQPARKRTKKEILERFNEKLSEEIQKRGLYEQEVVKKELIALSKWWRGDFKEKGGTSYDRYRRSSKELYADAISALLNNPEVLVQTAPQFFRGMNAYMGVREDFRDLYQGILNDLDSGATPEQRLARDRDMMAKDGDIRNQAIADKGKDIPKTHIWKKVVYDLADKTSYLPTKEAKLAVKDIGYLAGRMTQFQRDIRDQVVKPLEDVGITFDDLGVYLMRRRAAGERADLANPGLIRGKDAAQELETLKQDIGKDNYAILEKAAKAFTDIRKRHIIPKLRESRLFTDELMTVIENNDEYATFQVVDYYGEENNGWKTGAASLIKKQFGTSKDILNPFFETIHKDMKLLWAAQQNISKRTMSDQMRQFDSKNIKEAETRFNGRAQAPVPPAKKGWGLVTYAQNGTVQGVYVRQEIADIFTLTPSETNPLWQGFELSTAVLKSMFTANNPLFSIWNIQRDARATLANIPTKGVINEALLAPDLALSYLKTIKDAYQHAFMRESTPLMRELLEKGLVIADRQWTARDRQAVNEYERLQAEFSTSPKKQERFYRKVGRWIFNDFNQMVENWSKLAGAEYMKRKGLTDQYDMRDIMRGIVGSPDFLNRGRMTKYTNAIFLYSNAQIQGLDAAQRAFRLQPAKYLMRRALYSVLPTLALAYLQFGDDDDDEIKDYRDAVRAIPEYEKNRMITLPVSWAGKTVSYIPMPLDHIGELMHTIIWNAVASKDPNAGKKIMAAFAGAVPMEPGSLNPILDIGRAAFQYMIGQNPYDTFRGRPVVDETIYRAGGFRSAKEFGKWMWNNTGGSTFGRFGYTYSTKPKSEADLPLIEPSLRRFVRTSDRGATETDYFEEQTKDKARAKVLVQAKDFASEFIRNATDPKEATAYKAWNAFKSQAPEGYERKDFNRIYNNLYEKRWPKR